MNRRCFILAEADQEIDDQVAYYAEQAGASVAARFYSAVKSAVRGLLESPRKGRLIDSRVPALTGVRSWGVRGFPFLVYYREVPDGIEVIHVLHGAQDRDHIVGSG